MATSRRVLASTWSSPVHDLHDDIGLVGKACVVTAGSSGAAHRSRATIDVSQANDQLYDIQQQLRPKDQRRASSR